MTFVVHLQKKNMNTIKFLFVWHISRKALILGQKFSVSCWMVCLLSTCWVVQNLTNILQNMWWAFVFIVPLFVFVFNSQKKGKLKGASFPHLTRHLQKHLWLLAGSGWRYPLALRSSPPHGGVVGCVIVFNSTQRCFDLSWKNEVRLGDFSLSWDLCRWLPRSSWSRLNTYRRPKSGLHRCQALEQTALFMKVWRSLQNPRKIS